jgi:hypothetical protein
VQRFEARRRIRPGGVRETASSVSRSTQPRTRSTIISLLTCDLRDYLFAVQSGRLDRHRMIRESGLCCPECDSNGCGQPHAWRFRKKVTDLSTGEEFPRIPILRVRFCNGTTTSLIPAELWRGRCTVGSVIETVIRVLREGTPQAADWVSFAARDGEAVCERTLGRWRTWVRRRLIGSALSWLLPRTGLSWSEHGDEASQLERLLARMSPVLLAAFRLLFGRSVLDKPKTRPDKPHTPARRIAGRRDASLSHDPSGSKRPRGSWWHRRRRGPPPASRRKGDSP